MNGCKDAWQQQIDTMSDSVRVPRSDIRKVWSAAKKLARPWMDGNVTYEEWAEAMDFLEVFSGAAAVAPIETRDAFEAWMASSNYPEIADIALERLKDGQYKSQLTHAAWQAWQGALNNAAAPAPATDVTDAMVERARYAFCISAEADPTGEYPGKKHIRAALKVVALPTIKPTTLPISTPAGVLMLNAAQIEAMLTDLRSRAADVREAVLVEALRPFAKMADGYSGDPDNMVLGSSFATPDEITVADLRRAKSALAPRPAMGKGSK